MSNLLIVLVEVDDDLEYLVRFAKSISTTDFNTVLTDTLIATQCPFDENSHEILQLLLTYLELKIKQFLQYNEFSFDSKTTVRLRSDRQFIVEVHRDVI